jgi:hypothetical protein
VVDRGVGSRGAPDTATERRELMAAVLAAAGIRNGSVVLDFTPAAGLGAAAEAMAGVPPTSSRDTTGASHALACPALVEDDGRPSADDVARALRPGGRAVIVDHPDALSDELLTAAGLAVRWQEVLPWQGDEVRVVAAVRRDDPPP